jgi:hypothetical protein
LVHEISDEVRPAREALIIEIDRYSLKWFLLLCCEGVDSMFLTGLASEFQTIDLNFAQNPVIAGLHLGPGASIPNRCQEKWEE